MKQHKPYIFGFLSSLLFLCGVFIFFHSSALLAGLLILFIILRVSFAPGKFYKSLARYILSILLIVLVVGHSFWAEGFQEYFGLLTFCALFFAGLSVDIYTEPKTSSQSRMINIRLPKWFVWVAMIALLCIAIYFRWSDFSTESFRSAFHIIRSAIHFPENLLPEMTSGIIYVRTLLYQYLVYASVLLLGNEMYAYLLPGTIFSLLTIVIIFLFFRKWNTWNALAIAFLFTFSEYLIFYGTYRFYSMEMFLLVLAFFACYWKKPWLFFLSALAAIEVSQVGAIAALFPFILLFSEKRMEMFRMKKKEWKSMFFYGSLSALLLILYPFVRYFYGYHFPEHIQVTHFNRIEFPPPTFSEILAKIGGYTEVLILNFSPIILVALLLGFFSFLKKSTTKEDVLIRSCALITVASLLALAILPGFKSQPRVIFFLFPFLLFLFYFSLSKHLRPLLTVGLFLILNLNGLVFHVNKTYGTKIPEEIIESSVIPYIQNSDSQALFLHQYLKDRHYFDNRGGKVVIFTNNRWIDIYTNIHGFKKGDLRYVLIDSPGNRHDNVFQYYDDSYRYIFSGTKVLFEQKEIEKEIELYIADGYEVLFTDFFEMEKIIRRLDNIHTTVIYKSGYPGDSSTIWRVSPIRYEGFFEEEEDTK